MKKIFKFRKTDLWYVAALFLVVSLESCVSNAEGSTAEIPTVSTRKAELTSPPHVPPPVGARKAAKLVVDMEVIEKEREMSRWCKLRILDF